MTCSTSYLLYYTLMDPWNVPITSVCVCVLDFTYIIMYDMMVSKIVSTSTSIVPPDSLPPSPSNSAHMKTSDPQPPNLSASLIDTEQTPKRQKGAHDGTEPAAVGDILMEYFSD